MSSSWSNHRVLARKFTASTSFIFYICTHWSIWSKSMSDTFLNFYPVTCSYSDSKPGRQVEKINFKHCITEQESRVFHRRLFSQPLDLVPWNFSFWETCIQGTPPFRGHKIWSWKNVCIIFVFVTSIEGTPWTLLLIPVT